MKNYKILMIEDNPGDARFIKEVLSESRKAFFDIEHCTSLASGISTLKKGNFDLILLDLTLPDSDREKTFNGILSQNIDMPVLILTGIEDEELALMAIQAGAQDYLVKHEVEEAEFIKSVIYSIERYKGMLKRLRKESTFQPIKVLLVDDSLIALGILKRMLYSSPDMEVVGSAKNGKEALELIPKYNPDVICTDINMPVMSGLELTKAVMKEYPRPVLVISSTVQKEDKENVDALLKAGAAGFFPKPRAGLDLGSGFVGKSNSLIDKIKEISKGKTGVDSSQKKSSSRRKIAPVKSSNTNRIVILGASVGGPQALRKILPKLPKDFPVPIVCVLRINKTFFDGLLRDMTKKCSLSVKIAENCGTPTPGNIYFSDLDKHLEFDSNGNFKTTDTKPYKALIPSLTISFNSLAEAYGDNAIAILLSGIGNDGIDGIEAVENAGGTTIIQKLEGNLAFDLPKKAIELGLGDKVATADKISAVLSEIVKG